MLFFTSSGSRSSFLHNELSRPQGEACRGRGCSPRAKAAAGRATSPREAGRWHHLEAAELKLMQRDRSGAKLAQAMRRRAGRREEGCAREVPAPAKLGVSGEQQRDLRQLEYSSGKGEAKPMLTARPGDAGTRPLLLATNRGATTAPARPVRSRHRCQHGADEEE